MPFGCYSVSKDWDGGLKRKREGTPLKGLVLSRQGSNRGGLPKRKKIPNSTDIGGKSSRRLAQKKEEPLKKSLLREN